MQDDLSQIIEKRIEDGETLKAKVQNKNTILYLKLLNVLRSDYEYTNKNDKAYDVASEVVFLITQDKVKATNVSERKIISETLLSAYDCKARLGDFRSFCIALEWNRPVEKQFYLPRRRLLEKHGVLQAFQDVADDKLDFLCINMPPRTSKTTTSLFFLCFMAGLYPDRSILGSGHSTALTNSFFNECLNIMTSDEYRYKAIFPNNDIVKKNSEYTYLDLNREKRFHTMSFRSIDAGTTGLVEASNLLYCDDLIPDVETANNIERLDKLFYTYTSTIQDRKVQRLCKDGVYRPCPEIHVNTPWSINDVTNRLIRLYGDDGKNPRVRVISIPCYDENGESNFEYDYGKGFDKNYYKSLERAEDPVIFSAKYLMKCIERKGRPFTEDQLTFFYELPDEEPDIVVSYNDVAHGGDDYMAMPVGYVYGNEVYIDDVIYVNKLDPDKTRPLVCDKIIQHTVKRAGFEENNGGREYADLIDGDLKRRGYRCSVTTHKAPTNKSKLTRIMACQSEIKGVATEFGTYRLYFKAYEKRKDNLEYCEFMKNIYNWSQQLGSVQKTQQDGAPDSCAGLITNLLANSRTGVVKIYNGDKYGL